MKVPKKDCLRIFGQILEFGFCWYLFKFCKNNRMFFFAKAWLGLLFCKNVARSLSVLKNSTCGKLTISAGLGTFQTPRITAFAGSGASQTRQITASAGVGTLKCCKIAASVGLGMPQIRLGLGFRVVLESFTCCNFQLALVLRGSSPRILVPLFVSGPPF